MIMRVVKRTLRGLLYSVIGSAIAIYANHPVYGPIATAIGLGLDKYLRESSSKNE